MANIFKGIANAIVELMIPDEEAAQRMAKNHVYYSVRNSDD